jgi:hypothetical protein
LGEGPTAVPTDQGGSLFLGVYETGPLTGDVLDYEQPTAEGVEIEMSPEYVGQAGAGAGDAAGEAILVDPPEAAEDESFGTLEPDADDTSNVLAGEGDENTMARIGDIATGSPSEPVEPLGETVEDVGEALGASETIEDIGEAILVDPPTDTEAPGDVVEHMDEPAANAVYEGVETPPSFMEDALEGDVGDVGEEDVVEHMDDPVVDP